MGLRYLPELLRQVFGSWMVVTLQHAQILVAGDTGQLDKVRDFLGNALKSLHAADRESVDQR